MLLSDSQRGMKLISPFLAHARAFKAGIIHRDISAGNMLLYRDDQGKLYGLLNDWELSKKVDDGPPEGRQPDRTVSDIAEATAVLFTLLLTSHMRFRAPVSICQRMRSTIRPVGS